MSYDSLTPQGKAFGFPQYDDFDNVINVKAAVNPDDVVEEARLNPSRRVGYVYGGVIVPVVASMKHEEIYDLGENLRLAADWHHYLTPDAKGVAWDLQDLAFERKCGDEEAARLAVKRFSELLISDMGEAVVTKMAKSYLDSAYQTYAKHAPSRPRKMASDKRGWQKPPQVVPRIAA